MKPLTVDQYLRDTYVGKTIQFYVREEKIPADDYVPEVIRRTHSPRQYGDNKYKEWTKRTHGDFRDVLITDKIVGITTKGSSRVFWEFETLTGIIIPFRANMTFDIIENHG